MNEGTDPSLAGAAQPPSAPQGDADAVAAPGTTITIRFEPVARVALALAVLAGGYVAGRSLAGEATPAPDDVAPAAPPAASAPTVSAWPTAAPVGGAPDTAAGPGNPSHPLFGQRPPEVAGTLLDGTAAKLSDFVGKPLMINFWATWCPPCRYEMPWLQQAHDQHSAEGLVILAVNAGERVPPSMATDTAKAYVEQMGLTFPVLMPDDAYAAQVDYQVFGLPSSYFVTREGVIAEVVTGMFPNPAAFEATLVRVLGLSSADQP